MSPIRLADRRVLGALAAIATAIAVAGCKKTENPPADTAAPAVAPAPDTTKPAAAAAPAINDAQIASIVVTANSVDSAAGKLAEKKGASKAVKDFAKTMVTEANLGLAPGAAFGDEGEGWLRWCFAGRPEKNAAGLERLKGFLGR